MSLSKVPVLPGFDQGEWPGIEAGLAGGLRMAFGQAWLERPEAGFLPGEVRLGVRDGALLVLAVLEDERPFNPATEHNVDAYKVGDVFELFLAPAEQPAYFEIHVTPENYQLKLRLEPKADAPTVAVTVPPWERVPGLVVESKTLVEKGRWRVFMRVPLGQLVEAGGEARVWTVSCGRYDYAVEGGRPVCSSTSDHKGKFFHRRHEWTRVEMGTQSAE